MKKLIFPIIVLFVFAAGFILSRYWYSDKSLFEVVEELTKRPVVKEDLDIAVTPETVETSPSMAVQTKEDVQEALKVAFMQKYDKSPSEVTVTINQLTDKHASGGVKFAEEVGGGWFLAAKVDSAWKLVADGNGSILCSLVEPYNFPTSMVPECWDEDTMTLVVF